mmetsp:Transcript_35932/g.83826  ORF Transcript_35932/g.83826 Transcript_35932/m.83826 type:complete len:102 (+) Transcript_35932:299-604(+)
MNVDRKEQFEASRGISTASYDKLDNVFQGDDDASDMSVSRKVALWLLQFNLFDARSNTREILRKKSEFWCKFLGSKDRGRSVSLDIESEKETPDLRCVSLL